MLFRSEDRKAHLMECFAGVERAMEANGLTREEFIECVVYTEFSEWNDLFMYVVNAMKRRFRAFVPVAVGGRAPQEVDSALP